MEKKKKNLLLSLLAVIVLASCSLTFYNQWHTSDSYINTENPTSNSADSASINIHIPESSID